MLNVYLEAKADVCPDYNCKNGGTCVAKKETPECECPEAFEGDKCEKEKKKGVLVSYSISKN